MRKSFINVGTRWAIRTFERFELDFNLNSINKNKNMKKNNDDKNDDNNNDNTINDDLDGIEGNITSKSSNNNNAVGSGGNYAYDVGLHNVFLNKIFENVFGAAGLGGKSKTESKPRFKLKPKPKSTSKTQDDKIPSYNTQHFDFTNRISRVNVQHRRLLNNRSASKMIVGAAPTTAPPPPPPTTTTTTQGSSSARILTDLITFFHALEYVVASDGDCRREKTILINGHIPLCVKNRTSESEAYSCGGHEEKKEDFTDRTIIFPSSVHTPAELRWQLGEMVNHELDIEREGGSRNGNGNGRICLDDFLKSVRVNEPYEGTWGGVLEGLEELKSRRVEFEYAVCHPVGLGRSYYNCSGVQPPRTELQRQFLQLFGQRIINQHENGTTASIQRVKRVLASPLLLLVIVDAVTGKGGGDLTLSQLFDLVVHFNNSNGKR